MEIPNLNFSGGQFRTQDLMWRLVCVGLPNHLASQFSKEVEKYLVNSGPAWTVSRLKSIRNDYLRIRAGLPTLTWVRKNRKGEWYGVLGSLIRYSRKSEKCWKRVLIAFSIYTGMRPKQPTVEHCVKFRNSVEGAIDVPNSSLSYWVAKTAKSRLGTLCPAATVPLIAYQGHPAKRSPGIESSVPQDDFLEKELDWFSAAPANEEFASVYFDAYSPLLHGLDYRCQLVDRSDKLGKTKYHEISEFKFHRNYEVPPLAGNVVPLTKDGGWKVRWIASPFRVHQLALKPLGDSLFKALSELPWDCTYNQEYPLSKIQAALKCGKVIYSVDLSSATDFFPLSLQLSVLKALFPSSPYLTDLFRDLSRAYWRSFLGPVQWTKGQPMGLYPSFPSFAITHGMLLATLNSGRHQDRFFILGDDVVILDTSLYQKYLTTISQLGCPYDESKSICSDQLAEFAGKIITADNIYPKFKIGLPDSHQDSFMDLMRTYGQGFERFLPNHLRKVYQQVAHLLPPWGANHSNGMALPLEKVVELTEDFASLTNETKGGRLHVSFLKFLADRLKPERPTSLWNRLSESVSSLASSFERKRIQAQRLSPVPLIHEDVTDLFELTGVNPGLPAVSTILKEDRRTLYHTLASMIRRRDQ